MNRDLFGLPAGVPQGVFDAAFDSGGDVVDQRLMGVVRQFSRFSQDGFQVSIRRLAARGRRQFVQQTVPGLAFGLQFGQAFIGRFVDADGFAVRHRTGKYEHKPIQTTP